MLHRSTTALLCCVALAACVTHGDKRGRDGGAATAKNDGGPDGAAAREACACDERWTISAAGRDVPGSGGTPEPGGRIVVHMDSEPPHLQYMLRPDAWTTRLVGHDVLETLVRIDPRTHELGPELAESWEVSADGKTMTFHLREGVKWHDGRPFSSADVAFTFQRLMDPTVLAAAQRSDFENIDRWETPDPKTFVLHVKWVHFATLPNLDQLYLLPKHVFARGDFNNHPANRAPVGTGPFRFDHWNAGDEIVLKKNPNYWGRPAYLDEVVYRVVRERPVALEMVKRGEIDLMWRLLPEMVSDQLDEQILSRYHLVQYYPWQTGFWVWNVERPMFRDARVRRALTMLMNRDLVRCSVQRCLTRIIAQIFPEDLPSGNPPVRPLPFDPTGAKRLLDEAGWRDSDGDGVRDKVVDGKKVAFRFTFLATAGSISLQREAAIFQNEFRRAGIEMDIRQVDWAIFSDQMQKHEFDVGALIWIWQNPAIDLYGIFHSSQRSGGGVNYANYQNAEADRLLEEGRRTLDDDARNAMFRRLSRIIAQDMPYTFTFNNSLSALVSKKIHGAYTSVGWWQERDMWIPRSERR